MRGISLTAISDIHDNTYELREIMEKRGRYSRFLFAGDGLRFMESFASRIGVDYIAVSGNCDYLCRETPPLKVFEIADCKILLTHGHTCRVKSGLEGLIDTAVENDADLAVYGHTHAAESLFITADELRRTYPQRNKGLYIVNPGSLGNPRDDDSPSYAAIDLCGRRDSGDAVISVNIVRM